MVSEVFGQFDRAFRPIRMPLFFAVSGYLATSSVNKGWRHVMTNKVMLLLYLYQLWNIIQWFLFRYTDINNKALDIGTDPYQLISVWFTPTTGLWFIWALALYFIIARTFWEQQKRIVMGVTVVISVIFMSRLIKGPNFAQMFFVWYLPFFLGGMWYGSLAVERITTDTIRTMIVCVVAFVAATAVVNLVSSGLSVGVGRLVQSSCGLVAGCAASVVASRFRVTRVVLSYLGRNTLPIFLTHEMIVELLALFVYRYNLAGGMFRYVGSPVIATLALVGSLVLYRLALFVGLRWLYELPRWLQVGSPTAMARQTTGAR